MQSRTNLRAKRERLEIALGTIAALVAKDTTYLPFFQRLEEEMELMNANNSALDRAMQIAARQRATR